MPEPLPAIRSVYLGGVVECGVYVLEARQVDDRVEPERPLYGHPDQGIHTHGSEEVHAMLSGSPSCPR